MSINASLPVLFAQLPHLGQVASAEQHHPEAHQQMARDQAVDEFKNQMRQVQRLEEQEKAHETRADAEGGGGRQGGQGGRRNRKKQETQELEQETAPHRSPWSGHIVNVKI